MRFSKSPTWLRRPGDGRDAHPTIGVNWRRVIGSGAAVLAAWVAVGLPGIQPASANPHAIAQSTNLGPMTASSPVTLSLVLPLRHRKYLDALIKKLYDPNDPLYGHYLKPAQFTAQFGPTRGQVATVEAAAKAHGLKVLDVSPNNTIIHVQAATATVNTAFKVTLHNYARSDGSRFLAADRAPTIPSDLALSLVSVVGLDGASRPHHHSGAAEAATLAAFDTTAPTSPLTRPTPNSPTYHGTGGLWPSDVYSIYNWSYPTAGSGQNVGLVEFAGWTSADISDWESTYLTSSNPSSVTPTVVSVDGGSQAIEYVDGSVECTLDIDMVLLMAPGISNLYVYETPYGGSDVQEALDLYTKMATDDTCSVLSSSWGFNEDDFIPGEESYANAVEQAFAQMAVQGQTFCVAAGDSGAYSDQTLSTPNVGFEAAMPYVLSVGGTDLTDGPGESYVSETSWSDTADTGRGPIGTGGGGGISSYWTLPSFQLGAFSPTVNTQGSLTMRNLPDVSLYADYDDPVGYVILWTDILAFPSPVQSPIAVNGTSAAAPLWAGFLADVNAGRAAASKPRIGFADPAIYSLAERPTNYANDFHDINDGSNNLYYDAFTGYDNSTGWGSFNANNLYSDLVNFTADTVQSLTFSPSTLSAGQPTTGTVTLSTGAPPAGATVQIVNAANSPVATALVGSGSTTATFSLTAPSHSELFTAAYDASTASQVLNVSGTGAPTVSTAAAASPNPVTGTTTALSVSGADPGGGTLTYTWTYTGPTGALVTFSANGTSTSYDTTATFTQAGSYTFTATIADQYGLTVTSSVTVTVDQTLTSVSLMPSVLTLAQGATQPFTAVADDQFGNPLTSQPALSPTWSLATGSAGTLTGSGLYTAATAGKATVEAAVSGYPTAEAVVTIDAPRAAYAWGYNQYGQLGNGTTTTSDLPVLVTGASWMTAVSAGDDHSLAVRSDGTAWAWGYNNEGQLGNGTTANSVVPVQTLVPVAQTVGGPTVVAAVAGGEEDSLALRSDGTVWAWGNNNYGQLGDGKFIPSSTVPVQVSGLKGIIAVAAGGDEGMALRSDGTVWAWGYDAYGELGNGTTGEYNVPVQVVGLPSSPVIAIAVGDDFSLALCQNGTVWGWGYNFWGQLGFGTGGYDTSLHTVPVQVQGPGGTGYLTGIVAIAAGAQHSLAIDSNQHVWAWGFNIFGQLGNGTTSNTSSNPIPAEVIDPTDPSGFLTGVTAIACGAVHSLAIRTGGAARAWGFDGYGQLGNGTLSMTDSDVPVPVINPAVPTGNLTGCTAIAGGGDHSIALVAQTYGWGENNDGQLGNGTTTNSSVPAALSTLSKVTAIASSNNGNHSMALLADGTVRTWGDNNDGQLGNGATTNSDVAEEVTGLTGAMTAIAAGGYHSLAVRSDGTAWAWGDNQYGELGNGTTTNSSVPAQVSGLTNVIAVAGGQYHSLALCSNGTVWAWGYNSNGELGNGTTTNSDVPVEVTGLPSSPVVAIAAGSQFSLALCQNGTVWAWGYNFWGQLGIGSGGWDTSNHTAPVQVQGPGGVGHLTGIVAIAAGSLHCLAVDSNQHVWAWGFNIYGQLGNGTTNNSGPNPVPVEVVDPTDPSGLLTDVTAVTGGEVNSLAIRSDGTARAWGYNGYGQLGNGTTTNSDVPVHVINSNDPTGFLTGVTAIAGGGEHSLALGSQTYAWGENNDGQLGDATTTGSSVPVTVSALTQVIAIASSNTANHSMALQSGGAVWTWGDNNDGQLGNGTTTNSAVAVPVTGLTGAMTAIAAGGYHSLTVRSDGTTWAWGDNQYGELGNGTTTNSSVPAQVSGLTNVVAVAGGEYHSLALRSDGTVWAWGYNSNGELGNNSTTNSDVPVQVTGLPSSPVIAIAAGEDFSLALCQNGTVWGWGYNFWGQLGIGSGGYDTTNHTVPVEVQGPGGSGNLTGIVAIAVGSLHSLAIDSNQHLWAWGFDIYGQLGNGTTTVSSNPIPAEVIDPTDPTGYLTGVTAVAGGGVHSLALRSDGTARAWGYNAYGQLGNGTTTNSDVPVEVIDPAGPSGVLTGATAIAGGADHSLALVGP